MYIQVEESSSWFSVVADVLKAQIDAKMQENNYDCTHFLNFNKSENSLFNCEMLIFMNVCLSPRFESVSHN